MKAAVRRLRLERPARFVLYVTLIVYRAMVRMRLMDYRSVPHAVLINMGSTALARAQHDLAMETLTAALSQRPEDIPLRLQLGVTSFLSGRYQDCEKWFASVEQTRHFDISRWGMGESEYRILDRSWLLAIGHVAFLDTYIKATKLGWFPKKTAVLAYNPMSPPSGWPMFRYFGEHIRLVPSHTPEAAIDEIVHGPEFFKIGQGNRDYIRATLSQPFWFGPDATGRTRWFGPFGAEVEAAWKAAGHSALFAPTTEDRALFRRTMERVYGLPSDAWFVVLHVREPGYHAAWHRHHPGTRNADIRSYDKVIDFILANGGWVVRGGDPSMTKIPPRERVIDYATSPKRSPEIDIMLCAECLYFIGTNSGYSVVPPIFGKRCVLTNWSPIGIPNWYLEDIFIPKLVRRRRGDRYLTFAEMFDCFAGWSQFQRDFESSDLEIEDNHPDDLLLAVEEMHAEIRGNGDQGSAADHTRLQRFNQTAVARGGYVGSRMSYRFLAKYEHLVD